MLGLLIVSIVFGGLQLTQLTAAGTLYLVLYVFGAIALIVLANIGLGITATFISIHDRHAELVAEIRAWRAKFYAPETVE
jgi:hypothetical protein